MRTKHLFYTAAMAALFAACVNDDFETISKGQNTANDGRPVVSDVKLNFTTGADTRLAFGEDGYAWETNDTIGALLMDNVLTLEENKSWLQKYQLVSNIHTSYPFTYSTSEQTWGCNTKMLEGNYFFAYPWEDYDGRREVAHSLLKQSQTGIGSNVVAESYANNQFFIGYSQIKAGTDAKDALNDVEMVPLLGAIQLRIVNTGTQSYHLNKIVLSGNSGIASVMTFNPTDAAYGTTADADKWNLTADGTHDNFFNYANYTDNEADVYTYGGTNAVYNIEAGDEYSRIEALRAVVGVSPLSTEMSAQLTINGTAEERELLPAQANTAYVLIMCNPIEVTSSDKLFLSIYADEGFVQNIDLSKVNGESTTNTVVTDAAVAEVGPSVRNTIRVQLEDNSFITPETMTIYNAADLLQFIQWNAAITGNRNAVATLAQDVTFTAEMLEALESNGNTNLTIVGNNATLTLAEDLPANILDNEQLTIATDVVVEGNLALTKDTKLTATVDGTSYTMDEIEVAEGATLTINDGEANVPDDITNNGTLNIGAEASLKNVDIANYGTIEAAKGSDSRADITNNKEAVINNNGYMLNVTNQEDAVINMGEDATLSVKENAGKVVTADGATVNGTNTGEIVYVNGAVINATGGTISTEYTAGTLNAAAVKALTDNHVNKVILTGSTTVTENVNIAGVEVADGGELLVNNNVTLTATDVTVSGNATVGGQGTLAAANMEVKEEASLTVANTATITVSTSFTNDGMVYNNGTVAIPGGEANQGNGWRYNDAVDSSEPIDYRQNAMNNAMNTWSNQWGTLPAQYYNGNPYDYAMFLATINVNDGPDDYWNGLRPSLITAGFTEAELTAGAKAPAEFAEAVGNVLAPLADDFNEIMYTADGDWNYTFSTQRATLYPEQEDAIDDMCSTLNQSNIVNDKFGGDYVLAAYVWYDKENIFNDFLEQNPYIYIWEGCKLDEVMAEYRQLSINDWKSAIGSIADSWSSEVSTMESLEIWMRAILITNSDNAYVTNAKEVVEKYIDEYQDWNYSDAQVQAAGK